MYVLSVLHDLVVLDEEPIIHLLYGRLVDEVVNRFGEVIEEFIQVLTGEGLLQVHLHRSQAIHVLGELMHARGLDRRF